MLHARLPLALSVTRAWLAFGQVHYLPQRALWEVEFRLQTWRKEMVKVSRMTGVRGGGGMQSRK